ncbi:hypothetical protein OG949_17275 [Streptomyces scopuliridis]|uniref:hypothetical protein n=1 Tax=Streptomyces scopuliridis TaxID=452529 RepID=UPI002DDC11D1|nr:hypothetical protein [Streptomyces scopuliridis]WSB34453.1 hypothetical protein OG949_17275 [Streptomyces scopuliridis]
MLQNSPDWTNEAWDADPADEARDPLEVARLHVRGVLDHARMLDGEPGELIDLAIRTTQRAFDEIGTCNALLDEASDRGAAIAEDLLAHLTAENAGPVTGLFDALDALTAEVAASEANRRVANRILGQDGPGDAVEEEHPPVPRLTAGDLPRVPSLYDSEQPGYGSLTDMLDVRERTAAQRAGIHARRVGQVTTHIVDAVTRLTDLSFSDERFARETLTEVRRAYALWHDCVTERRQDLE